MLRKVDSVKILKREDGTYAVKDKGVVYFRDQSEEYTRVQGSFKNREDAIKFAKIIKSDASDEMEAIQFIEARRCDD